jgi:chromosome partition protein MukF
MVPCQTRGRARSPAGALCAPGALAGTARADIDTAVSNQEPSRVLAGLAQRRPSLSLDTLDLGFLVALHLRAQHAASAAAVSFGESALEEVFDQVCDALEPTAEQRKKRATYAIARMREQRLLSRVDGHGVVRSGEYALTRLATGIVDFFLEEDVLTRESLTLLAATLRGTLGEVLAAARQAGGPEAWAARVEGPLRITAAELVAGIERRQRGLDLQQEEFQAEIRRLLEADWFGAISRCQGLLESTSATLRELGEILLRDTSMLLTLLHDIEELAVAAGSEPAIAAVQRVIEQIDRIAAWGGSRQRAWSEYFQYVHRYLRDVVRLDPTRALTQRLRDQLAGTAGKPYVLALAGAPPIKLLRTVAPVVERPPVVRPKAPRDREPAADPGVDPQAVLEARVQGALDRGAEELSKVTEEVTAEVESADRFVMAGRIAQTTAALAQAKAARERPWVRIREDMMIEDWQLSRRAGNGGAS